MSLAQIVANPRVDLGVRTGSLLASITPEGDDRWQAGVTWVAEPDDGQVYSWAPCTQDPDLLPGVPDPGDDVCPDVGLAFPVTLTGIETGGSLANQYLDWQARAERKLLQGTSLAMERELWTGAAASAMGFTDNPYLASAGFNFLALTAAGDDSKRFGLVVGLATLQKEAMAIHGDPVILHASPRLVSMWDGGGHVYQDGTRLRDRFGNLIIAGAGYPGTGPGVDDSPVGFEWAYATAGVSAWYSPDPISFESLNRRTNRMVAYAQRDALAIFDDVVHVGIRIDLCTGCIPS